MSSSIQMAATRSTGMSHSRMLKYFIMTQRLPWLGLQISLSCDTHASNTGFVPFLRSSIPLHSDSASYNLYSRPIPELFIASPDLAPTATQLNGYLFQYLPPTGRNLLHHAPCIRVTCPAADNYNH